MRTTRTVAATIVAVALLLTGAGCSSDGSDASGGTTASPADEGGTTAPTGEGSGDPGAEDGGAAPDLPDDWPAELALPDGVTVTDVATSGGTQSTVVGEVDDPEAVLDAFEAQLSEAGWEILGTDFTDSEEGGFGRLSGRSDDRTVAISVGPDPTSSFTQITILSAAV